MSVKSPIRWVGGKSKIRNQIINILPPIGTYSCYVEAFGGAGWVLFGKQPSPVEVYNDVDEELVNFFLVVQNSISLLLQKLENYPITSRKIFEKLVLTDPKTLSEVDRAYRFYYIIMASWGGEFNYPRFQTSKNDGGNGNRLIGALRTIRQRLYPVYERLSCVNIEKLDWKDCIEKYDDNNTVFYFDPPYPSNKCNYVHNMRKLEDHIQFANYLSKCKSKWVLSSYNTSEIHKLFSDYYFFPVTFASGMDSNDGRVNNEVLITNYDVTQVYNNYENLKKILKVNDFKIGSIVNVVKGEHKGSKGRIREILGGNLSVQINKGIYTISPYFLEIKNGYQTIDSYKILRKEITSSLDNDMLCELVNLKKNGEIENIPTYIRQIITNDIERFLKS